MEHLLAEADQASGAEGGRASARRGRPAAAAPFTPADCPVFNPRYAPTPTTAKPAGPGPPPTALVTLDALGTELRQRAAELAALEAELRSIKLGRSPPPARAAAATPAPRTGVPPKPVNRFVERLSRFALKTPGQAGGRAAGRGAATPADFATIPRKPAAAPSPLPAAAACAGDENAEP